MGWKARSFPQMIESISSRETAYFRRTVSEVVGELARGEVVILI